MIEHDSKKCWQCGACVGVCSQLALGVRDMQIIYDQDKCIDCAACVLVCPSGAMKQAKPWRSGVK